MLYIGSISKTNTFIHHTKQNVKYLKKPRNLTFAQNLHKFYKKSLYSTTPHRSTDQKVEGSNPSGRATNYRGFLRFLNTLLSATRIRIFRFFCQKMGIFRGILHKICTKSAQYNLLLLLNLCIFG